MIQFVFLTYKDVLLECSKTLKDQSSTVIAVEPPQLDKLCVASSRIDEISFNNTWCPSVYVSIKAFILKFIWTTNIECVCQFRKFFQMLR